MSDRRIEVGPDPATVRAEREVKLTRPGVDRTQFFFSYSGGWIIDGKISTVTAHLNGWFLEIAAPCRIAPPSFRPTPQLDFQNVKQFFQVETPTPFPLRASTFPGVSTSAGATADYWFGPSDVLPPNAPIPPADTILVTYWGPASPNEGVHLERYIVRPFLEWLRVLTRQWWIGRSIEGVNGALHFIAPQDEQGRNVGSPTPVVRMTTAGLGMTPVTDEIWIEAWRRTLAQEVPPASRSLEMDADYMIASEEYRSGVILACSAIEAARDDVLTRVGAKHADMKTSATDLLKHLSVGLENVVRANLESERPELFQLTTAFWRARGEAAHGRPVYWRIGGNVSPIEDVDFGTIADNLAHIIEWLESVQAGDSTKTPATPS